MRIFKNVLQITLMLALLSACNPSTPPPSSIQPTLEQAVINTLVAKTVEAMKSATGQAENTPVPIASPTIAASATPLPATNTPVVPTVAGATSNFCESFNFVGDVTIPDGMVIPPGSTFTKMWVLKNTGSCTWSSNFKVVYVSGDNMGAPSETPINGPVAPGKNAVISVKLKAPDQENTITGYTAFFKMKDPGGNTFGWGPDATKPFWAKIKVDRYYLFGESPCNAAWRSGTDLLYCPTKDKDPKGYFQKVTTLTKENGITDKRLSLVFVPPTIQDGMLSARFEPIYVPRGAHFKTDTGCLSGAKGCNVKMGIMYSVEGGPEQILEEWDEIYDGFVTGIDFTLKDYGLDNKNVTFILYVKTNGGPEDDFTFWVNPRVIDE